MAEDYAPTTEDVADAYRRARIHLDGTGEVFDGSVPWRPGEFDAWLAAHDRQVAERAGERIAAECEAHVPAGRLGPIGFGLKMAAQIARADPLAPRPAAPQTLREAYADVTGYPAHDLPDAPGVSVSAEQVEAAMTRARATREFWAGSRFEVPTDAVEPFTLAIVKAALGVTVTDGGA